MPWSRIFGAAQQQLGRDVVKAYLSIRKAREDVGAVEAGVKAYEAAVAAAHAPVRRRQMLKADLLSLEVQLAQTQENLAAARHGAALAERAFRFVLGLDSSTEAVELATDDPALARLEMPTPVISPSGPNWPDCANASAPPRRWSGGPGPAPADGECVCQLPIR